jgi:hypothetical protein
VEVVGLGLTGLVAQVAQGIHQQHLLPVVTERQQIHNKEEAVALGRTILLVTITIWMLAVVVALMPQQELEARDQQQWLVLVELEQLRLFLDRL